MGASRVGAGGSLLGAVGRAGCATHLVWALGAVGGRQGRLVGTGPCGPNTCPRGAHFGQRRVSPGVAKKRKPANSSALDHPQK